jgi:hypothetical protein
MASTPEDGHPAEMAIFENTEELVCPDGENLAEVVL